MLVTIGPRPALLAKERPASCRSVALAIDDPVDMGLAASRTRPGGHITGLVGAFDGILSRRLQVLKDFVPEARRFAVLMNPATLPRAELDNDLVEHARELASQILAVRGAAARGLRCRVRGDGCATGSTACSCLPTPRFFVQRMELAGLCLKHRLPSIWGGRDYLERGGLASFQGDFAEVLRAPASLVDKILKGTPPGEIPFEQSTKFELVAQPERRRARSG